MVPNYQEFSLFSAFSSRRFGETILESSGVQQPQLALDDARDGISAESESGSGNELLSLRLQDARSEENGVEDESVEQGSPMSPASVKKGTGPIDVMSYRSLAEQNAHLTASVHQLQDIVFHMTSAMDRLNYDHCLVLQQLQAMQQAASYTSFGGCHEAAKTTQSSSSQPAVTSALGSTETSEGRTPNEPA